MDKKIIHIDELDTLEPPLSSKFRNVIDAWIAQGNTN